MIAYLDLVTGLSGDMMIGALLSAGWSEDRMREALTRIPVPEATVIVESRRQHSLVGKGIRVEAGAEPPERSIQDVRRILATSSLDPVVKERSLRLFERLAGVEAAIHGIAPDDVHFHELGAIDSIVDIVLTVAGIADLGVARLFCGPVPLSRGSVETAHGTLPVPTPATLALLEGIPVRWLPIEGEWTTPTGALILSGLVDSYGPPPEMRLAATGIGAGTLSFPDCPNIVRLLLGTETVGEGEGIGWVSVIECNIDDMDPRLLAEAAARIEKAGALDVSRTPTLMKKGRHGTLLTVLCRPDIEEEIGSLVLQETTTLGIRLRREFRREMDRWVETVVTQYGPVRIKWSRPGGISRPAIEFEDLRARSLEAGVPAWEVERAALAAVARKVSGPPPAH